MLQAIRDRTKGWIAYVIVGLIVVPFALFGVYNYLTGGANPTVAEVNGIQITRVQLDRAVNEQRNQLRQMLGERYDPAMFDDSALRRQVLDQMIDQAVLTDFVRSHGFRVSDQSLLGVIRTQPMFQVDGRFSAERYHTLLQQNGIAPEQYEAQLRRRQMLSQLQQAVGASAIVTDAELARFVALRRQQRDLSWLRVSAEALEDQVSVDEKAVAEYYQAHREAFRTPERVRLSYLELDASALAGRAEVDEAALRERYEEVKDTRFVVPAARHVRHLLIAVPEDADEAAVQAARERIAGLRERIVGAGSFAEVAREHSDDIGTAAAGGDMGFIQRGDTAPDFQEAAFSLDEGEVSEPVRTEFGWHLIQVTEVRPEQIKPFEEVRDEIRSALARERLDNGLAEAANRLANLAYENPNSLQPAAEALGLEVKTTDWIPRGGGSEGLAAESALVEAAFSPEVLEQRLNSRVIELGPGRQVVIRVRDHRAAEAPPLDQVRERVRESLVAERAAALAREKGEALLAKAESGTTLEQLTGTAATSLQSPGWVGRDHQGAPAAVINRAFRLPHPAQGERSLAGLSLPAGDYAVVAVGGVRQGEVADLSGEEKNRIQQGLRELDARISMQGLLAALRQSADVEVFEDRR